MTKLWLEATDLQRQIVALSVTGAGAAKIASSLRISEPRVRLEMDQFMAANGLDTREQVGALAVRAGIV